MDDPLSTNEIDSDTSTTEPDDEDGPSSTTSSSSGSSESAEASEEILSGDDISKEAFAAFVGIPEELLVIDGTVLGAASNFGEGTRLYNVWVEVDGGEQGVIDELKPVVQKLASAGWTESDLNLGDEDLALVRDGVDAQDRFGVSVYPATAGDESLVTLEYSTTGEDGPPGQGYAPLVWLADGKVQPVSGDLKIASTDVEIDGASLDGISEGFTTSILFEASDGSSPYDTLVTKICAEVTCEDQSSDDTSMSFSFTYQGQEWGGFVADNPPIGDSGPTALVDLDYRG
jgi:hypothetical protein